MSSTHLVEATGGVGGRWSLKRRRGWLWRRGHREMRPALDVCETRGDDIRIFYVSWVEGEQLGCMGILDVAEVSEPKGVDDISALGLVRVVAIHPPHPPRTRGRLSVTCLIGAGWRLARGCVAALAGASSSLVVWLWRPRSLAFFHTFHPP